MKRVVTRCLMVVCALCLLTGVARADSFPIGLISWDVNIPGSTGAFDITNQTGPNASVLPDTTFPVVTPTTLSNLALAVDFVGGGHTDFGSSYFTLSADGLSFIGGDLPIGGANPLPTRAILTGTLSPTSLTLSDGSIESVVSTFSATIPFAAAGLADGDFAVLFATTSGVTPPPAPEPATTVLLGLGFGAVASLRRRRAHARD